jgi:CheY-like chemotaxis protein
MNARLILVIENDLSDLKMISDTMKEKGFYVSFAPDAESALKILVQTRPFLILMGLTLPKMDRYTFTRILKSDEDTKDIIIIGLSDENSDKDMLISSGFDGVVNVDNIKKSFTNIITQVLMEKKTTINNKLI